MCYQDVSQATKVASISALRRSAAKPSVKTEFQWEPRKRTLIELRSWRLSLSSWRNIEELTACHLKRGSLAGVATAGAAALLLTGCGAAPEAGSSATADGQRLHRLHRLRLRWIRRPVIQPVLLRGPEEGGEGPGHQGQPGRVQDQQRLRAQPARHGHGRLRPDRHGRLPARRRHQGPGHGKPGQPLRHHRLRLRDADQQRQADHLRHGAGGLPGRLPRGRHHQDRNGRHLRRHQDPHRHHLHGRLRRRREVLQRTEGQERQGPRLGQGKPRTAASPATSKSRTRASSSPRTSWTRARTS